MQVDLLSSSSVRLFILKAKFPLYWSSSGFYLLIPANLFSIV